MKQRKNVNNRTFDTPTNPFDHGKSLVGLDNKKKKASFKKQMQRLKDRIDQEKDEDIKRELRKGNLITIMEDSLDY